MEPLKLRARIFWLLVGTALLVGFISLVPAHQKYCSTDPETHEKQCAQYHVGFIVLFQIGKALDRAGGVLTALATVFIAGFTFTLWRTTSDMQAIKVDPIGWTGIGVT